MGKVPIDPFPHKTEKREKEKMNLSNIRTAINDILSTQDVDEPYDSQIKETMYIDFDNMTILFKELAREAKVLVGDNPLGDEDRYAAYYEQVMDNMAWRSRYGDTSNLVEALYDLLGWQGNPGTINSCDYIRNVEVLLATGHDDGIIIAITDQDYVLNVEAEILSLLDHMDEC